MSNSNKRWTIDDKLYILESITNGLSINNVSLKLERTEYAIIAQIHKLLESSNNDFITEYHDFLINKLFLDYDNIKTNLNNPVKKEIVKDDKKEIKSILNEIITEVVDYAGLYDKQIDAFKLAKKRQNLFITGAGGCGKSTILIRIIKYFKTNKFNVGVTGSTGVSASLINGTTVHSFLKMGLATKSATELYEMLKYKNKTHLKLLQKLDVLIIEEVSMIDNILFSKISKLLSLIKGVKKPFGDIQIILCGDFTQLQPINNLFCFESKTWSKLNLNIITLDKQMRQDGDKEFQEILSYLRFNDMTQEIYDRLSLLRNKDFDSDIKPTILYSKNVNVDKINENEYKKVAKNEIEYIFDYIYNESNNKVKKIINKFAKPYVKLCKGLQVMLTYNIDIPNHLVNGTRAIITDIQFPNVFIKTRDGKEHIISYVNHTDEYDDKISYDYIPLKLAYAITIHKCCNENTLIYTKDGLKRINKISTDNIINQLSNTTIEIKENIIGKIGNSVATQIYKGNIENTIEIRSSLGYFLEGSKQHPILIYNNGKEEWKTLSEIKINDYIIMKYNTNCFGSIVYTDNFTNSYNITSNTKIHNIPPYINKKLSYIIGLLIGDGCYSVKKDFPIEFTCSKNILSIKNKMSDYFMDIFNVDIKCYNYTNSSCFKFLKCSKHIRDFLEWCGLDYITSELKQIPWVILENNKECQIECLKGLFDTDGGVNINCIHYTSISKQLVIDIQNLLLNIGIISSLRNLNNNSDINHKQAYRLQITGYQAYLYYNYIGFNDTTKQEKLKKIYSNYNCKKIKSNILEIPNGVELILNLRKEIYLFYGNIHRCNYINTDVSKFISRVISKNAKLRLYDIKYLCDNIDNIDKYGPYGKQIKYMNDNNIFFDKIIDINISKSQLYDLYVPGDHTFIGNGIINHNSQGITLDYVSMDLGKDIFGYGMAYVALSRSKSLNSIHLIDLHIKSFKCDPKVKEFYENL